LIVGALHGAEIREPRDLRDVQKRLNAFAKLDKERKAEIPSIGGKDWLDLLHNPGRTEELKTVLEALHKQLKRRTNC
jgi:hypothetical protein